VNMLTSSTESRGGGGITPAGLVHSVGVALLEMAIMSRGAKKTAQEVARSGLPRFVDVKLDHVQKIDFIARTQTADALVVQLQDLCDSGYRIGVTWSGEQQAYTVSLTCRDDKSPNSGCCMTSFAKRLDKAVSLALYKHFVVCGEVWPVGGLPGTEEFG